jgi:hypothetical protein
VSLDHIIRSALEIVGAGRVLPCFSAKGHPPLEKVLPTLLFQGRRERRRPWNLNGFTDVKREFIFIVVFPSLQPRIDTNATSRPVKSVRMHLPWRSNVIESMSPFGSQFDDPQLSARANADGWGGRTAPIGWRPSGDAAFVPQSLLSGPPPRRRSLRTSMDG